MFSVFLKWYNVLRIDEMFYTRKRIHVLLFYIILSSLSLSSCVKEDFTIDYNLVNDSDGAGDGESSIVNGRSSQTEFIVNLENEYVQSYLNTIYDENDYTYTQITDYVNLGQKQRKDYGEGILLEWQNIENNLSTHIVYSTNSDYEDSIVLDIDNSITSYYLYNLIPNSTYWVKVVNNDSNIVKESSFETIGRRRLINLSIGFNCRDIGGVKTIDDRTIKYGLYFRGGELDGRGQVLDDYDHDVLENVLKIKDVFDFRAAGSATKTPIVGAVYHSLPLYSMVGVYNCNNNDLDSNILNNYKTSLEILLDCLREGRPVYAHCQGGCDRTNTMCFLIMGVLGVSENDLALDYELSSFAQGARYAYNTTGGMIRSREPLTNTYHNNYRNAIDYIKSLNGTTLKDKFEWFWVNDLGVSIEQINELRDYMLMVSDNTPTTGISSVYMDR